MKMPSSSTSLSDVNRRVAVFESDTKVSGFLSYRLPFAEIQTTYSEIRWGHWCCYWGKIIAFLTIFVQLQTWKKLQCSRDAIDLHSTYK